MSAGCSIGLSRISRSVIGVRSTIGDHVELTDSILMGADFYESKEQEVGTIPIGIGDNSIDRRAIIGDSVRAY